MSAPQRGSPSYILGVIRHFLKWNNVRIKHLEQSKTWIKTRLWHFDYSFISSITTFIIYMTKLLQSDWLRGVQLLTIIEWGWARYEELSSPKFAVINRSRRLRLITANWGLDNSSYCAKTEFNNCFIIYLKNSKQTVIHLFAHVNQPNKN
jgi:hypothetical protein